MLDIASFGWLFAAAASVPATWWLHRLAVPRPQILVSAAFLWREAASNGDGGRRRPPADRWWLLRAGVLALIGLVAAGPGWRTATPPAVEVWFDDGIAMASVEADGSSRGERAIDALLAALDNVHPGRVVLHSLSRPGDGLALAEADREGWRRAIGEWLRPSFAPPALPPAVAFNRQAQHWLVSDGSDSGLRIWAASVPLSRLIAVAGTGDNVGIAAAALRRNLDDPARLDGFVELDNTGSKPAMRQLNVTVAGAPAVPPIATPPINVTIPAGGRTPVALRLEPIAVDAETVAMVSMTPADVLVADDHMSLSLAPLARTPVAVHGACPPPLRAALAAHPGLTVTTDAAAADLVVACGDEPAETTRPLLWFRTVERPVPMAQPVVVLPAARALADLSLDAAWLTRSLEPYPAMWQPGETALLSDGVRPFVTRRDGIARRVAVDLDIADGAFAARPEYPALIAGLLDILADRPLLDPIVEASRPRERLRIAPTSLPAPSVTGDLATAVARTDLSAPLLVLALALTLIDAAFGLRRVFASSAQRRRVLPS